MRVDVSDIVRPTAGKGEGKLFIVVRAEPGYVYLADGKRRRACLPKKKKRRHVAFVAPSPALSAQAATPMWPPADQVIRKELSSYRKQSERPLKAESPAQEMCELDQGGYSYG